MITSFGTEIDKYLLKKINDDNRDYSYFHPSGFGGCQVKIWLESMGYNADDSHNATNVRIFDNGHFVHLRNQIYAKNANVLSKDKVKKTKNVKVKIGVEEKERLLIEGEKRNYYYKHDEYVWVVEDTDIYYGTDNAPVWRKAKDLKKGNEWWLIEVPLVDEEYHFGGHCDAIVLNDGKETVIDYKGVSDYSMSGWSCFYDKENSQKYLSKPDSHNSSCFICGKSIKSAKELTGHLIDNHMEYFQISTQYKVQLHIYMMLLNIDMSILWYENKNSQIVVDMPVERDENIIKKVQKNAVVMWNKIQEGKPPKRPKGYTRNSFPCSFCNYAPTCYNLEGI